MKFHDYLTPLKLFFLIPPLKPLGNRKILKKLFFGEIQLSKSQLHIIPGRDKKQSLILCSQKHAHMLSCFSLVWLFSTLWTIACQASLSMGFSRQEYWDLTIWKTNVHKNLVNGCLFIVALKTTVKMSKQPRLPSICEWVNKLWTFGVLIQKMEY